jgi:uncharacterized protein (DUF1499 family)
LIGLAGIVVIARIADLFAGRPPENLGVRDGALAPCPASPNCVASTAQDAEHAIAPLAFSGSPQAAFARLARVVADQPRARVVAQNDGYLRAEFKSAALDFVDDVEFLLDPSAGVIQVRSASRLGRSDFGVNRKRVEALRAAFGAGR